MATLLMIALFLAVLVVLILVHEWGHFIVAKLTGMRVDEFGVGFPPKIGGIKKGETEYTVNWLPIGGFVRIWGENYDDGEGEDQTKNETLSEADRARAFSARPKWAQALVLVAGVAMNILFAWLLFSLTFMMGTWSGVDESEASDQAELMAYNILPESPAAESLPMGAIITAVSSGEESLIDPTASEFISLIGASDGEAVTLDYQTRDGAVETAVIEPRRGIVTDDPERYGIGVSVVMVEEQSHSFFTAVGMGFITTVDGFKSIVTGLYGLLRDAVVGQGDFSQVAGPVGIVGMVGDAASYGLAALMSFTAIISLNLAVINLLPVPALDGGRLVFVAIEAITRKPIPPVWAGRVNLAGFALLMLLMVAVTFNDITRLL